MTLRRSCSRWKWKRRSKRLVRKPGARGGDVRQTNQFNLTTRRHSRPEVQAMLELPGAILLALRLRDKFGEQGIVALLLASWRGEGTLKVDSFLVSCRALGRGVEDVLWTMVVNRAHRKEARGWRRNIVPRQRMEWLLICRKVRFAMP
jgi:FkbH-like protein